MGGKITKTEMESYPNDRLMQLRPKVVKDLKPEVRAIFDRRKA